MKKTIYLAGKMEGLTNDEIMNWRKYAKDKLKDLCNVKYAEPISEMKHFNEVWDRDYFLLDNSDIILVNFDYEKENPFLGTSMEIARAYYQRKPIIIFSSKDWVKNNFTLKYHATCIVNTLDEAIDFISELL